MSTSSGATRLKPVARSGEAGGSRWTLQDVRINAGALLADRCQGERGDDPGHAGAKVNGRQGNTAETAAM